VIVLSVSALRGRFLHIRGNRKPIAIRGTKVQFQVNEQNYFLDFIDEEQRWFLFKPTLSGIEVMPVVSDDAPGLFPEEIALTLDTEVVN
jgi:hypothetical protein